MEMADRSSASEGSTTPTHDKGATEHVERIMTVERVPGHDNYYEKDGLRTYGDDEGKLYGIYHSQYITNPPPDHDHEPPMTASRFMSFVAMAFLWTGSQIPVYLFGGVRALRPHSCPFANNVVTDSTIHLRRHWWSRPLDLVHLGEPAVSRCRMPIRRLSLRFDRPSLCRSHGRRFHRPRHDYLFVRALNERLHLRNGLCRCRCWY